MSLFKKKDTKPTSKYDGFTSISLAFNESSDNQTDGSAYFRRKGDTDFVVEISYSRLDNSRVDCLKFYLPSPVAAAGVLTKIQGQRGVVTYGDGQKFGTEERPASLLANWKSNSMDFPIEVTFRIQSK